MPNRILREGILTSERVNSLGWEAEVFYRRLMSVADDYGRFHAHPALLRAALFPLKLDAVRDGDMARLLAEVEAAGLVRVYVAEGKRYVQMLDFRQRVRAHASKFPPPQDGGHTADRGWAAAGLGGGVVKDGVVDEGGGGGEGGGVVEVKDEDKGGGAHPPAPAPATPPPGENTGTQTSAALPLHVQIAVKLREHGVNITSAHPHAHAWAARGLTVEHALEALAIARLRKPEGRIAPNYLAPIIEDMLNPRMPARAKSAGPPQSAPPAAWWASEAATLARGRELGVHAHPGEAMGEYRARVSARIAEKALAENGPSGKSPPGSGCADQGRTSAPAAA